MSQRFKPSLDATEKHTSSMVEKRFISNAGLADFYTVFAKRAYAKMVVRRFLRLWCKDAGLQCRGTHRTDGASSNRDRSNGCHVPAEDMVGNEGDGFGLAMATLDTFRASVGAAACGWRGAHSTKQFVMRRSANSSAVYWLNINSSRPSLQIWSPNSTPLASSSTVPHMRETQAPAESLAKRAKRSCSPPKPPQDHRQRSSDPRGAGLVTGTVVERLYRDVRALRIYEGHLRNPATRHRRPTPERKLMKPLSPDTTPDAQRKQYELMRQLSPEQNFIWPLRSPMRLVNWSSQTCGIVFPMRMRTRSNVDSSLVSFREKT